MAFGWLSFVLLVDGRGIATVGWVTFRECHIERPARFAGTKPASTPTCGALDAF